MENKFKVNEFLTLANNEEILKIFPAMRLVSMDESIYFVVTNYRLIYLVNPNFKRGTAQTIAEFDVNTVNAITTGLAKLRIVLTLWLGIIFFIIGILSLGTRILMHYKTISFLTKLVPLQNIMQWGGVGLIVIALLLLILGFKHGFYISIQSMGSAALNESMLIRHTARKKQPIILRRNKASQSFIKDLGSFLIYAREGTMDSLYEASKDQSIETYILEDIVQKQPLVSQQTKTPKQRPRRQPIKPIIVHHDEEVESKEKVKVEELLKSEGKIKIEDRVELEAANDTEEIKGAEQLRTDEEINITIEKDSEIEIADSEEKKEAAVTSSAETTEKYDREEKDNDDSDEEVEDCDNAIEVELP